MKKTAAAIIILLLSLTMFGCGLNYQTVNTLNTVEADTYAADNNVQKRVLPELYAAECETYPSYENKAAFTAEQKSKIYDENKKYISADFIKSEIAANSLKKHPAADGQFGGALSDDAAAVKMTAFINTRIVGWRSLNVFAPAGEVVTVRFDDNLSDEQIQDMTINIGYVQTQLDIPLNRFNNNRLPLLKVSFKCERVMKIGSPYGGTVYLNAGEKNPSFNVEVSGGVECPNYTYGVTTKAEWDRVRNAGGLYAQFNAGFLKFFVPSSAVREIADPNDIMEFWFKAASLSAEMMEDSSRVKPVLMVYDYHVPAGAAVAYVGAWFCIMPNSWAAGSLNYTAFMQSGGWGTLHEFNHHFQGTYRKGGQWGMSGGGEVTNNVLNAATYAAYTNIAAYRTEEGGLSAGNALADPYNTIKPIIEGKEDSNLLRLYAALMHGFGIEGLNKIINNYYHEPLPDAVTDRGSADALYYYATLMSGMDMADFVELFGFRISDQNKALFSGKNLPKYVPLFNLYASSRDGSATGRPFYIPSSKSSHVFDFRKFTAATATDYSIEVSGFKKGKLTHIDGDMYEYIPFSDNEQLDDFSLIYTFADGSKTTLTGQIGLNVNNISVKRWDNLSINNIDDAINFDVMKAEPDIKTLSYSASVPSYGFSTAKVKSLGVAEGKIVPTLSGTYSMYVKGDDAVRLVMSSSADDRESYDLTAEIKHNSNAYNQIDPAASFKINMTSGKAYYFKLYNYNVGGNGWAQIGWTEPSSNGAEGSPPVELENKDVSQNNLNNKSSTILAVTDVPSGSIYGVDVKKTVNTRAKVDRPALYTRPQRISNTFKLTNVSVISAPEPQDDSNSYASLTDGDYSTFYHTRHTGTVPPFPHDYTLDLGSVREFNTVKITPRRGSTDMLGSYEIKAGDVPNAMRTIASGVNDADELNINLGLTKARYLTVSALNNKNGEGYNYTVLAEIEVLTLIDVIRTVPNTSDLITYRGNKWRTVTSGAFANGLGISGEGEAQFTFSGNYFGFYALTSAEYGWAEISVDYGDWEKVNLYSLRPEYNKLVYAKYLDDGEHTVRVRNQKDNQINVDFFVLSKEYIPYDYWWIALIVGGVLIAAAITLAIVFRDKLKVFLTNQRQKPELILIPTSGKTYDKAVAKSGGIKEVKEKSKPEIFDHKEETDFDDVETFILPPIEFMPEKPKAKLPDFTTKSYDKVIGDLKSNDIKSTKAVSDLKAVDIKSDSKTLNIKADDGVKPAKTNLKINGKTNTAANKTSSNGKAAATKASDTKTAATKTTSTSKPSEQRTDKTAVKTKTSTTEPNTDNGKNGKSALKTSAKAKLTDSQKSASKKNGK